MGWMLDLTSSPAFNFGFSFTAIVWAWMVGAIIGVKILKEAFRR